MTKQRATIELVFASVLWGFGFVATIWALTVYTSAELLFLRFLLASVGGMAIYFLIYRSLTWPNFIRELRLSFIPGMVLGGFMLLQTIGMETTTATKSGFITATYVLFVPIINQFLFRNHVKWQNYGLALLALAGTYLLMGADLNHIVKGDYITLFGAALGGLHIVAVGLIAHKSKNSFLLNNLQSFWTFLTFVPFVFAQQKVNLDMDFNLALYGVLALAFGSSLLAFTIQVRTQKVLSDELASQIFLLEAPFGFLFGYLLLSETLNFIQVLGALVIIISSLASIRYLSSKKIVLE